MAYTYQTIVDLARIPLNDSGKARYSDEQLLLFANHGMLAAAKRRPDLFIGQFNSLPNGEAVLGNPFELDPAYAEVIADYVVMRAEMMDDEHANSGRALISGKMFNDEMPL
jgi:hypothetical protein